MPYILYGVLAEGRESPAQRRQSGPRWRDKESEARDMTFVTFVAGDRRARSVTARPLKGLGLGFFRQGFALFQIAKGNVRLSKTLGQTRTRYAIVAGSPVF